MTISRGIIWDNHACMPLRADDAFLPQLERLRAVGVDIVSLNVGFADTPWEEHLRVLSYMRCWIAKHPDRYRLVATAADAARCKEERKLGVVFDIEGMRAVEDNLSLVQTFYELGVRWMLIAYNRNNKAGGGCLDEDGGLTDLGRAIIDEMERVGMILCLSHTGARTATDALEYARRPVIFSHSNAYGYHAHARNISDDLMIACARKGGVVGVNGIGLFLGGDSARLAERLVGHLLYMIDRIGADHVGLALDYVFDRSELEDYVRQHPELFPKDDFKRSTDYTAMVAPEELDTIAEGLAHANLTEAQIRSVMGENWMRLATELWR